MKALLKLLTILVVLSLFYGCATSGPRRSHRFSSLSALFSFSLIFYRFITEGQNCQESE